MQFPLSPTLLSIPTDVLKNHIFLGGILKSPSSLLACSLACRKLRSLITSIKTTAPKQRAILRDIFSNGYLNYLEWLQASLHYPSISDLSRNWPVLLDESIEVAAEGIYFCFLNCTFFNH